MERIYKTFLEKDGKQIRKLSLIYIDEDKKLCDACDEMKVCASIQDVAGSMVSVVCKDCLQEIINEFPKV